MAKSNSYYQQRETERKYRKFLRDNKRKDKFQGQNPISQKIMQHRINVEAEILRAEKENLYKILDEKGMLNLESINTIIYPPENFSFEENYTETLNCIKSVASSLVYYMGYDVQVNFVNCKKAESAALFVLQVINLEILEVIIGKSSKFELLKIIPRFMIGLPKNPGVERLLIITGFLDRERIEKEEGAIELQARDHIGYLKGSEPQKSHAENKKGPHTKKIVTYLDKCLNQHGYKFTLQEWNDFEGIISEALSNAEDHSGQNSWYISANFSQEVNSKNKEVIVGEVNLSIMNFGSSMYEAFIATKEDNKEFFDRANSFVVNHMKKNGMAFDEEQLFMFIMIQDQISRLKFEKESRGTGTMKFINSFLELGDFEDTSKGYNPQLSIYSGKSLIVCDNTCKPIKSEDGAYSLALNAKNDLTLPPEKKYLKKLRITFPGTLLSVKIYLNKGHMDIKYKGENGYG
jgi:hypothetical protein